MAASISATSVEVAPAPSHFVKVNVLGSGGLVHSLLGYIVDVNVGRGSVPGSVGSLVDVNVGGRGAPSAGSTGKLVNVDVLGRSGSGSASTFSSKGSLVNVAVGRGRPEYAPAFAGPGNLVVNVNDLAAPQFIQYPLYPQYLPYGRYRYRERHRWGRHGHRHRIHYHGWDYGK